MSYQEQETVPEEKNPNGQEVATLLRIIAAMEPEDADGAWTLIGKIYSRKNHQPQSHCQPHYTLSGPGTRK
jgi:hypothetical protein